MSTDTTEATHVRLRRQAFEALTYHLRGHTYEEIAKIMEFSNRSVAYKAVMRALKITEQELNEVIEHGRSRAHARYALLFKPAAEKALAGDMAAMREAIKLADRLANIEGVQPPQERIRIEVNTALDTEIADLLAAMDRVSETDAAR